MRFPPPLRERFYLNINKLSNSCWEWTGYRNKQGYGQISVKCKQKMAHRISWELTHGYEPKKFILHICDNPSCVNPKHLYEGNIFQNMKDKIERNRHHNQKKVSCPKGHLYDEKNTRIYKGRRYCRFCDVLRVRVPEYLKKKTGRPILWEK